MIRRGSVEIGSNHLAYTTNRAVPKGIPIVLVHGLGGAASDFEQVFLHPDLSRRCLIAPDLLGFGDSDKPDCFSYDLADQADLLDAILGKLGYLQIDLVAHSMGGIVAILLALRHPDRVRRLIVAEPNLVSENARISRAICSHGSEAAYRSEHEAFIDQYNCPDRPSAYRFHQTLRRTTSIALFCSSRSLLLHAEGGLYLDFLVMNKPRDYLKGEKSWQVATPGMLRDFAEAGIGYHVIPDAGHGMMGDNPQVFCDKVEAILSEPCERADIERQSERIRKDG